MRKINILLVTLVTSIFCIGDIKSQIALNSDGLTYDLVYNAISDKELPLATKFSLADGISNFIYYDELKLIYESVLNEAKLQNNDSIQMQMYNRLALICIINGHYNQSKSYLDSASLFLEKVDKPYYLSRFYNYSGAYYGYIGDKEKAHEYYYKVIDMYEKTGEEQQQFFSALTGIGSTFATDNDEYTLKRIVDKMSKIRQKVNSPIIELLTNSYRTQYYIAQYVKCTDKKNIGPILLDSIRLYTEKNLEIQNSKIEEKDKTTLANTLLATYTTLAYVEIKSDSPNWHKALEYILDGERNVKVINPVMQTKLWGTKSLIYYHLKNYKEAIRYELETLQYLDTQKKENGFEYHKSIEKTSYEMLASCYEGLGNFKEAYKYRTLEKNTLVEEMYQARYETIKEMEAKYDSDFKEKEIQTLRQNNVYQSKIRNLYISIIVLLIIIFLVMIYFYHSKRKAAENEIKIAEMKKEEAELKLQLKEEQAARTELEKYEALLEVHFKELEIEGKESELNELNTIREHLDKEIEVYSQKLKEYERHVEEEHQSRKRTLAKPLVDEMSFLVKKRIHNYSEYNYLEKLQLISNNFISQLESISRGSISSNYLKYCICFAINMEIKDVAECFCVEQSSVHMVRYRLKKKLTLNNNDDLNVFLGNLLNSIPQDNISIPEFT